MDRLAVFGAGGHGMVVAEAALGAGWREIVFFDDALEPGRTVTLGRVAGGLDLLLEEARGFDGIVVGLGNNAIRLDIQRRLLAAGARMATIVHPAASVSPRARLGAGSVVLAGAIVVIGTSIGPAAIINTAASIDHDCMLGEGVHVSPGARLAGGITVGARSWLGIGCAVIEKIEIGADVVVGAGAVVTRSCTDGITILGNPARPLECS